MYNVYYIFIIYIRMINKNKHAHNYIAGKLNLESNTSFTKRFN